MVNRSSGSLNPIIQIIIGFSLGVLFLMLSLQVVFPRLQIPFLGLALAGMGLVDFVFHEAGHIIFGFMGHFILILGGTIAQVFLPIVCILISLKRRQWFNLSIFLFWLGQSLAQISRYVGDASTQELKLFSPGVVFGGPEPLHDWHYLLHTTGLLWADQYLAAIIFFGGICCMLAAAGIHFVKAVGGIQKVVI